MSSIVRHTLLDLWARLFAYAFSLTRDRDQAADVLQQSAIQALAARHPPHDERAIRAWLFKIVRNVWIDAYRRESVRRLDEPDEDIGSALWTYDDRIIAELTVNQGLQRIGDTHREIIELVDIHGFRYAEAAQILGVAEGTIMSRLSRARQSLLHAIGGNVVPIAAGKRRLS